MAEHDPERKLIKSDTHNAGQLDERHNTARNARKQKKRSPARPKRLSDIGKMSLPFYHRKVETMKKNKFSDKAFKLGICIFYGALFVKVITFVLGVDL